MPSGQDDQLVSPSVPYGLIGAAAMIAELEGQVCRWADAYADVAAELTELRRAVEDLLRFLPGPESPNIPLANVRQVLSRLPRHEVPDAATDLAQHVAWLEQVLKPGMSITRTKHGYYLKRWTSWTVQVHSGYAEPRTGWKEVDSDPRLAALLGRLGEHS